jgi:hypothetical protein
MFDPQMLSEDSFHYAIENTRVLVPPQRRIETFGNTSFQFCLITELMDRVGEVRVRKGQIHAERPQLLLPGAFSHLLIEGFGEKAQEFADWLQQQGRELAVVKYGFRFRKSDVTERVLQSPVESVRERCEKEIRDLDDPLNALIEGVDDAWEVCLLKFAADLVEESAGGNAGDFRKRGLL